MRREQRLVRPTLELEKRHEGSGRCSECDCGVGRPPAVLGGAAERVDQDRETADDGQGAGEVEVTQAGTRGGLLGDDARSDEQRDQADGAVDPEDEVPIGPGGDGTADEDAGCDTEAADGTPQGEGGLALGACVGGRDQRERGRGEECGAEALDGAGDEELGAAVREPAADGGEGEQGQAGQEDAASRDQVCDPAAEEQAAAGHHEVGGDQPLQVGAAQVQGASDRWGGRC